MVDISVSWSYYVGQRVRMTRIRLRRAGTKMMTNMMRAFRAVVEIIVVVISSGSPEVAGA